MGARELRVAGRREGPESQPGVLQQPGRAGQLDGQAHPHGLHRVAGTEVVGSERRAPPEAHRVGACYVHRVKVYTARQAHEAWSAGTLAIVDVREEVEHDATRVPDVPLIPMSELLDRLDELPPDRPLAILCRSGSRSASVADYLVEEEGRDAGNLEGGIIAWAAEGLPYEGEPPR